MTFSTLTNKSKNTVMRNLPLVYGLVFILIASSCSMEKRKYTGGFHIPKKKSIGIAKNPLQKQKISKKPSKNLPKSKVNNEELIVFNQFVSDDDDAISVKESESGETDTLLCDRVVFHDGNTVECLVLEVSNTEIKYKKCEFEEGPTYIAATHQIASIRYRNGTQEYFGQEYVEQEKDVYTFPENPSVASNPSWVDDPREWEIFSVMSIALAILPPTVLVSVIFGFLGLNKTKSEPEKYKGRGLAIGGLAISAAWCILFVLLSI